MPKAGFAKSNAFAPTRPWACAALCACLLLAGCKRAPPAEEALRTSITTLQRAIQTRDAGDLDDVLADDFIGNDALDKRGAKRLAALMFMQNANVRVVLGPMVVEVKGDRATVSGTAVVAGGSGSLIPDSGQIYDVRSGWRLRDGDWELRNLEWTAR